MAYYYPTQNVWVKLEGEENGVITDRVKFFSKQFIIKVNPAGQKEYFFKKSFFSKKKKMTDAFFLEWILRERKSFFLKFIEFFGCIKFVNEDLPLFSHTDNPAAEPEDYPSSYSEDFKSKEWIDWFSEGGEADETLPEDEESEVSQGNVEAVEEDYFAGSESGDSEDIALEQPAEYIAESDSSDVQSIYSCESVEFINNSNGIAIEEPIELYFMNLYSDDESDYLTY